MENRKLVLWGSGNVSSRILSINLQVNIDFIIDNDEGKKDGELFGRKIFLPTQVKDWKDIYIIIAIDNYLSVYEQLKGIGLSEQEDFIWYRDWLFPQKTEQILREAEFFLNEINTQTQYKGSKLFFSDFPAFDKGVKHYVERWNQIEKDIVIISEAAWIDMENQEKMHIPIVKLPAVLSHNQYLKGKTDNLADEKMYQYVQKSSYLQDAAENLRMGYPDMMENYEYIVCFYADKIVRKIIEEWKPSRIILWNAFYAFHFIIRKISNQYNIPLRYMEFGNIPGTIITEEGGQMGESYPAKYPQDFLKILVSEKEYTEAKRMIEALRQSGLNRNVQPHNNLMLEVKSRLKDNRPIVFYAGQNDNASGMQPYTKNTEKFHSPVFTNSDEAALFLAEVCRKNDWNYIYKPHPMMIRCCNQGVLPDNVILVDNVNINELIDLSNVVVTILSTVSYIALIRQKPVVMLGYTQLKSKGCTYEAFQKADIEKNLLSALANGLLPEMNMNFIRHVVQIGKYYSNNDVMKGEPDGRT